MFTIMFRIIFTIIFTKIFTKIFTRIFTRILTKIFTIIFTKIFTRLFTKIFPANLLCKLNSNYTYYIYCIYCTIYLQMKIKNCCFVFKHWVQIMQKAAYGIIICRKIFVKNIIVQLLKKLLHVTEPVKNHYFSTKTSHCITESVKFQFAFYTLFLEAIFLILSSSLDLFS
jgi:hypothetical protein